MLHVHNSCKCLEVCAFYYSILVDMPPIFTTTSSPTEQPATTSIQSVPATTTESPVTTTSQSPPPTTTEQPMTTTLSQSTLPTTTQGEWTVYFHSELIAVFYITGVFLSLNGVTIPSDGYVAVSDIGIGSTGLHCNTDRSDCCRGFDHPRGIAQGHWYLPNGIEVMTFTEEDWARPEPDDFFSRDRRVGVVRLNHNGNPTDRGRFRCEIPDTNGVTVTLHVNIGK